METEQETCTRPKWLTKLLGCTNKGVIPSQQLPAILSDLNPGLNVDEKTLKRLIRQNDPNESGVLDFDTVTRIIFQLVLKQPYNEEEMDSRAEVNGMLSNMPSGDSDCSCKVPGACKEIKITDFILFPTF